MQLQNFAVRKHIIKTDQTNKKQNQMFFWTFKRKNTISENLECTSIPLQTSICVKVRKFRSDYRTEDSRWCQIVYYNQRIQIDIERGCQQDFISIDSRKNLIWRRVDSRKNLIRRRVNKAAEDLNQIQWWWRRDLIQRDYAADVNLIKIH